VRRHAGPIAGAFLVLAALAPAVSAQQAAGSGRFQHALHASYPCAECHSTGRATSPSNRSWCAECHHRNVGYDACQRCHAVEEIAPQPVRALVTFDLSVGPSVTRSITFDHGRHVRLGCGRCHSTGGAASVQASCTSCHTDHHQPGRNCTACHAEPPVTAHPESIHLDLTGCGQAGCHQSPGIDFAALPDERNLCLACHPGQRDHEAPQPCARCHILGEPAPPPEGRR